MVNAVRPVRRRVVHYNVQYSIQLMFLYCMLYLKNTRQLAETLRP